MHLFRTKTIGMCHHPASTFEELPIAWGTGWLHPAWHRAQGLSFLPVSHRLLMILCLQSLLHVLIHMEALPSWVRKAISLYATKTRPGAPRTNCLLHLSSHIIEAASEFNLPSYVFLLLSPSHTAVLCWHWEPPQSEWVELPALPLYWKWWIPKGGYQVAQ